MNKIIEIKSDILEYGVKFYPYNMFSTYKEINKYKIKKMLKKPEIIDNEVYDVSTDNNVIPSEILLQSEGKKSIVKLRYNTDSIIEIKLNGKVLKIYKEGKEIKEINAEMIEKYSVLEKNTIFRDEKHIAKINEFVDIVGLDRISVLLFDGCLRLYLEKP